MYQDQTAQFEGFALLRSFSKTFGVRVHTLRRWHTRGLRLRDGRRLHLPAVRREHYIYSRSGDIKRFLLEVRAVGLHSGTVPAALPDTDSTADQHTNDVCIAGSITSPAAGPGAELTT